MIGHVTDIELYVYIGRSDALERWLIMLQMRICS